MKKEFNVIYKYITNQKVQQWQIIAENNKFWTIEGQKDGKLTTSLPTICKPKNIGKANATSAEEQCLIEAKAKWTKKINSGYNEVLSSEKKFFEPMLAKDAKESKDLIEPFKIRVFVQPKYNGVRCINQNNTLMSRNGKPYLSCPHLHQNKYLLDGEMYLHSAKGEDELFNKMISLVKQSKPTQEDLQKSAEFVEYWIYDLPEHKGVFSKRYEALQAIAPDLLKNSKFKISPVYEVFSWNDIKNHHSKFIGDGYEGTIIRLDITEYENKRCRQLLKYKDFIDEEFTIIGYEEGEGSRTGTIGKFIMQHDVDPNKTFKSNIKGNFDYLRNIWTNRQSYIDKTATVKYFMRTPLQENGKGDVPLFPYIINIDRESIE